MSKKIVAVNAGPRKGWNTDTLISEAAQGGVRKGRGAGGPGAGRRREACGG